MSGQLSYAVRQMNSSHSHIRTIAIVSIFAALSYVLAWGLAWIPNVKLTYFIVYAVGFVWGMTAGAYCGILSALLWTLINPFGPAPLPIILTQLIGTSSCGLLGSLTRPMFIAMRSNLIKYPLLALIGLVAGLLVFIPINLVDAWLYQPFWPRFWVSMVFSLAGTLANCLIFPLLYPVVQLLYQREQART